MNRAHKCWQMALRLGFTIAVVVTLFHFVDWRDIVMTLSDAEFAWLLPAYALVLARRGIEAWQLTLVLHFVGCPLSWFRVFRANALAAFYTLFTPGSIVPAAVKWTDLAMATGRRAIVLNAILYSRLLLDLQPTMIGAGALAIANPTGSLTLAMVAAGLAALGLALAICLFATCFGRSTHLLGSAVGEFLPNGLRTRLDRLIDELEPFRALSLRRHLFLATTSISAFAVGIVVRLMIMKSLGFEVPLLTIIWVEALLVVTSHVPITVGNFGVREGLVVAAFALHGVPADVAVAYGLLLYGCRMILALIGASYQVALIAGWATMRPGTDDGPGLPPASASSAAALLKRAR